LRNTLDYAPAGLIARVQNDAGLATTFAYDTNLQRTQISHAGPGNTALVQHFDYDALGALTQLSLGEGEQARPQMTQASDAQGRLRWRASALGILQTWQYDTEGHLLEQTARNRSQTRALTYRYDDAGQLVAWADNAGRDRHLRYDEAGRPTAYIDALGREVAPLAGADKQRHWRDDFGRLLASATPDTGMTRREFDAANRLVAMTDATGNRARYQYDAQGRIERQTVTDVDTKQDTVTEWRYEGRHLVELRHPGQSERYTYDPHGWRSARIVTLATPQGEHIAITRYEHDANGQLVATTLPDGSRIRYERNGQGQVVALTRNRIATPWLRWLGSEETLATDIERDLVGLSAYTAGNGIETRYQRSAEGTLARVVHRASGTRPLIQAHRLDPATVAALLPSQALERLLGIAPAQAQTEAMPPRLTLEKPATATATAVPGTPGALGLPADPQALIDNRYLWDAEGNLLYQRQAQPDRLQHASQAYDAHNRLVVSVRQQSAEQTSAAFWRYAYDNQQRQVLSQQGAPRQDDTTTGTRRIEHAADSHRLTDASYRADGLPSKIGTRAYAWNPLGRLTEVRDTAKGTLLARYGYDHRGLRNAKEVDGQTTRYLYGESRELTAELDQNGRILRQYLYLGDQPLALIDSPEGRALGADGSLTQALQDLGTAVASWFGTADLVWLHTNHLGAPEAATDGQGQAIWRADYAPFGSARTAAAERAGRRFVLNLRLPGQYHDIETGLHYNRARYYDPEQGQYLSPDPLGHPDGPNPYAYVAFNPLRYVDADGLILFAFDGTDNDESDPNTLSNVVKFKGLYRSDDSQSFYITGPGTLDPRSGIENPLTEGGNLIDTAKSLTGKERITYLIQDLQKYSNTADDNTAVDIDVVGFSRGAAEARDFANQIVNATTDGWYKYEADEDGKKVTKCQKVNFRFMGLFDTVLSTHSGSYALGIPDAFTYVSQASALNEYRGGVIAFPGESIMQGQYSPVPVEGKTRIEKGFLGSHADIGGSFAESDLSKIALVWMVGQATAAGVSMDESKLDRTIIANPVLHDKSSNLLSGSGPTATSEDRVIRFSDGSSSKQQGAVINGMSYEDTVKYITYKGDPNSIDNISGTVDVKSYLEWLNKPEQGYNINMTVQ
jgi:RHS repeat-associated protein